MRAEGLALKRPLQGESRASVVVQRSRCCTQATEEFLSPPPPLPLPAEIPFLCVHNRNHIIIDKEEVLLVGEKRKNTQLVLPPFPQQT
jgi:hypothetical protein